MSLQRRILHIDMDAFFASVEQVLNPELKGRPLIIGGDRQDTRGVVSTASYEARQYGVHSAMPLVEAKRLCPDGVFMRGRFEHYRAASEKVRAVLETVSPLVEAASIDEAYIDVSGSQRLFGGDCAIAQYIKRRIREETQLPCTVAVGPNKLVAKVGSDEAKPDGYLEIEAGGEAAFLRPLSLRKLPGVGPRTREMLESLGVFTVGALADLPLQTVLSVFGQTGYALQRAARGISTSPVEAESVPKSISRETTFERDLLDWGAIERILIYLTERAAYALREKGMEAKCVTLKVRHSDFKTYTFARTLAEPTSLDRAIVDALRGLVPNARERRAGVRLIGVALTTLTHNQHQLRLFDGKSSEKWERALAGVDRVRERHGFDVVRLGRSIPLGRRVQLATPSLSR
ncbi:MAG: DNA polymerase IV [Candidatus Hydrogenedentes bacterium]|nr:DNA polymerase IV [Candidatus Hydrogenedentota bacterium]